MNMASGFAVQGLVVRFQIGYLPHGLMRTLTNSSSWFGVSEPGFRVGIWGPGFRDGGWGPELRVEG